MVQPQRKRLLINIFLILSLLAFVGLSIAPLLGNRSATTPSPTQNPRAEAEKTQLEKEVEGYTAVLQREPENQAALNGLVQAKLKLGDIAGLKEPLEKLAKLNPTQTEYAVLLAQVQQQTGDREGAAKTYRSVIEAQPGDLKALNGLSTLMLQENRPEAAIGLIQETLKRAPIDNEAKPGSIDVPSVQLILAQVYAQQKRYDEAMGLYEQIQKASPQDFRPILAKGIVLKSQGKSEAEYKPLFDTAASLAPSQFKDEINRLAKDPVTSVPAINPSTENGSQPTGDPTSPPPADDAQPRPSADEIVPPNSTDGSEAPGSVPDAPAPEAAPLP